MMEWTQELPFSRSYLMVVIAVAAVVGGLAVFGQSSTLALAAAILGLYVLHLFSNWQLASNQRQQWQTLREVERMLGALDSEAEPPSGGGAAGGTATTRSGAGAEGRGTEDDGELRAVGEASADTEGTESADERGPATAASDVSAETPEAAPPGESAGDSELGDRATPAGATATGAEAEVEEEEDTVLVPRQYKLGTVAVVERVLTPGEVARVLAVQDRHPDRQFGDIAADLGLISQSELDDLLETQREGLYRPEAISRARRDLKKFRREKAEELGTGP